MKPVPEGGHAAPGITSDLKVIFDQLEWAYADLLGIEAVSAAFIKTFGDNATNNQDEAPIGGGALGGSGAFYFDMPCSEPYHIAMLFARSEDDDTVKQEINTIFADGAAGAAGTSDMLCSMVRHISEADPTIITNAVEDQKLALLHAHGRFIEDFANVEVLVDRHFTGGTSDAFLDWYIHVDDVLEQLIFFAGVAQVGAAGTANALSTSQNSILQAADQAKTSMQEAVEAWRNDPRSFPFPPGTAARAMKSFGDLTDKIKTYASLIPGPIGKAADVADTTISLIKVGTNLFGDATPLPFTVAPRAAALLDGIKKALTDISDDTGQALALLGENTSPQLAEVQGRSYLALPRLAQPDDPGWTFND